MQINGQTHLSHVSNDHGVDATNLRSINAPPQNAITDHAPSQQAAPQGGPIDGGRECTTNTTPGWEEREAMAEERAMRDPEYAEAKALLEKYGDLEEGFLEMDKYTFWKKDSRLIETDIQAVLDNPDASAKAKAFARLLKDNPKLWSAIAGDDNLAGVHDVRNYVASLKSQIASKKDAARAEVNAELGIASNGQAAAGSGASGAGAASGSGSAGGGADAATADVKAQIDQANPKPSPSQYSGLEGATENMNNMIGWGEGEIDRLTELMGKTDDPATLKQLENKINQMTRRMQQMTALMNQLSTAMQNISKMYSDIAMNAVRNMK